MQRKEKNIVGMRERTLASLPHAKQGLAKCGPEKIVKWEDWVGTFLISANNIVNLFYIFLEATQGIKLLFQHVFGCSFV